MNYFKRFFILFIVLMNVSYSVASEISVYEDFKRKSYHLTITLCNASDFNEHAQVIFYAVKGFQAGFSADDSGKTEISPELSGLMDGDGFYQALNECFGSNEQEKNLFVKRLIFVSSSGKAISYFLSFAAVTRVLQSVKSLRWVVPHAAKIEKIENVSEKVLLLAVGGLGVHHFFLNKKVNEIMQDPCGFKLQSQFDSDQFSMAEKMTRNQIQILKAEISQRNDFESIDYQVKKNRLDQKVDLISKLDYARKISFEKCRQ